MSSIQGVIFDIKRFAIRDGPGIRTTIFFKGCPLNCWWCQNPEGISPSKEIFYYNYKCIDCKLCIQTCSNKAIVTLNNRLVTYQDRCSKTGKCVDICPTGARQMVGTITTNKKIMSDILKGVKEEAGRRERISSKLSQEDITQSIKKKFGKDVNSDSK